MTLAGKKIVITGAAGALGAGVAQVAHSQGAEVVLLETQHQDFWHRTQQDQGGRCLASGVQIDQ